jgi:hypothetical protein
MVNIMCLAHPDAIRPVDGIDFIWQEIHNGVIERWFLLMLLISTGSSCLLLASIGLILCLVDG